MTRFIFSYKLNTPILISNYRSYSYHRRYPCSYYEVLRISPDATQKEIKDAYIKLCKQMHPDSGGKGNHNDFVNINEAYMILSKKDKRREYDINLKSNNVSYSNSFKYNNDYRYKMYDFERAYTASRNWEPYSKNVSGQWTKCNFKKIIILCIVLIYFGIIIQLMIIKKNAMLKRYLMIKNSMDKLEYENMQKDRKIKLMNQHYQRMFESSKQYKLDIRDE